MLEAISNPQIKLLPRVQFFFITRGSSKNLKTDNINIVTNPKPRDTKNWYEVFNCAKPNGLKRKRNTKIKRLKTRMKASFSLGVSILLYGFLNGFSIKNYLQTNLYNICKIWFFISNNEIH
jgi:hypothetical protein